MAERGALFPSDALREGPLELSGRVLVVDGSALIIADAFASLRAHGAGDFEVEEGDWITLRGELRGSELYDAAVIWRCQAPSPRGGGDVDRVLFQGVGRQLLARARAIEAIRRYFVDQSFLEVETPFRVPAPGVDLNVGAFTAEGGFLITSPELEMKRLVVSGIPRQFQFARVSRSDEAGALHEAEFTLLEWYRACAGLEEMLLDTEGVVRCVAASVAADGVLTTPSGQRVFVDQPFVRLTMAEAFRLHAGENDVSGLAERDEARYFELLVERVEPALARQDRPVFLMEYPISQAALARPCSHDPRFAERFELYAGGVELCNGYGELTCPREQRRRFQLEDERRRAAGQRVYPIHERFLAALEEGMPPTGGNALGFDRLLMLALGARQIQDVMAFPRSTL